MRVICDMTGDFSQMLVIAQVPHHGMTSAAALASFGQMAPKM
nr:hypothetical protein [Sinorhizobium medicae]